MLDLIDATHADAGHGRLSLASHEPMGNLHLSVTGNLLELCTAVPPAALHLGGTLLDGIVTIHLNGRAVRRPAADPQGRWRIVRSDWADGGHALPGVSTQSARILTPA
jgi:hypothetical protein